MRDRRLENHLVALDDYRDRWERFRDMLRRGLSREPVTPADDAAFLQLKGELAHDYGTLMGGLGSEAAHDAVVLNALATAASLQRLAELDATAARELESDWHTVYIHLQSLSGRLRAKKLQLASASPVGYYLGRVLRSPVFILMLLGAMVAAGVWYWNFVQPSSDNTIESRGPRPTLENLKP